MARRLPNSDTTSNMAGGQPQMQPQMQQMDASQPTQRRRRGGGQAGNGTPANNTDIQLPDDVQYDQQYEQSLQSDKKKGGLFSKIFGSKQDKKTKEPNNKKAARQQNNQDQGQMQGNQAQGKQRRGRNTNQIQQPQQQVPQQQMPQGQQQAPRRGRQPQQQGPQQQAPQQQAPQRGRQPQGQQQAPQRGRQPQGQMQQGYPQGQVQQGYPQGQVQQRQPIMSNQEANSIYSGQSLEQIIFGYIEPSLQAGFLESVNSFDNIKPIMAPDVNSLVQYYRRNNIAGNILLFVFNPNEVEPVARFLRELDFTSINPSLMTVMIVRDKDLDISPILQVPNIGQFCKVAKLDKLAFTKQLCNKIIAQVVKKQPTYPELTKVSKPEEASMMIDKKTFKVDFDRVKDSLAKARKGSADVELAETIKKKILSMTSTNESLSNVQDMLPQLKLLKDLESELSKEIEKIKYKDGFKDELAQMLIDKILLSTLGTKELKEYLKEIIEKATEEKMLAQNTLTSITPEDVERINSMHEDTSLMMQKRNELEKQVTESYNKYLIQSQLVINAVKLEERRCISVNNEMCELLRENVVPDGLQEGMSTYLSKVKAMRAEVNSLSQKTTQELTAAFQMANTLLKDQSTLIKIDNVLLAALQQEVELLNKTQNTVMVFKTGLKAKGSIVYRVAGSHMRTIFNLVLDESDFVVSIRNHPSDKHLNIGDEILTASTFLEKIPEEFGKLDKRVELQLEDSEDNIERILSTIDYISKYYRRIYIIVPLSETLGSSEIHVTEEAFRNSIAKVSFWTTPDHSKMLLVNSVISKLVVGYKDIMLPSIIFNDVPKGTTSEEFDRLQVDANLPVKTHVYSIAHLRSLEMGVEPNPATIRELRSVIEYI